MERLRNLSILTQSKNKDFHLPTTRILQTLKAITLTISQDVKDTHTVKTHLSFNKKWLLIDLHKPETKCLNKKKQVSLYLVIGNIHYKNIDNNKH